MQSQTRKNVLGAIIFTIIGMGFGAFIVNNEEFSIPFDIRSTTAHFDTDRLARIDTYMEEAVKNDMMVGGLAVLMQHGKIIYSGKWGHRDRAANAPMTEDTIFRIYSMSKPITSVAIMILVEEGKIRLDAPVATYIPSFANITVHDTAICKSPTQKICPRLAKRAPTVRDLLTHSAGLTYGMFSNPDTPVDAIYRKHGWFARPDLTLEKFTHELAKIPLVLEPASLWHYSIATDVLGRLVEVASNMEFEAFLQTRIFIPLGMKDSGFAIPSESHSRFAQLYTPKGINTERLVRDGFAAAGTPKKGLDVADPLLSQAYIKGTQFKGGGGGMVSTIYDYLRFAQMLLNGGTLDGIRILSPETVALMTRDSLGADKTQKLGAGWGFGLGFGVVTDAGLAAEAMPDGSYTWGGAAGTIFWNDPQNNLIGIFMTQSLPHISPLREQIRVLTYQALVH